LFPGESGVDQLVEIIKVTKKTLIPYMEKKEKRKINLNGHHGYSRMLLLTSHMIC
jgi:hypothetical protein